MRARVSTPLQGPLVCANVAVVLWPLRQGAMELWDSTDMEWVEYHFVLTRSGFLHWFISTDDIQPTDGMNLQRSSMEAGEPPIFSVLEVRATARTESPCSPKAWPKIRIADVPARFPAVG